MNSNRRQSALTLMEMTVVIGIIAVLAVLAAPATKLLFRSFESEGGTKAMISSALASARAIAAKEQRYAGIRFQKVYDPTDPLGASQYIVFIVHDYDLTGLANGFRAVGGLEPIKLPDTIGVTDLRVRTNHGTTPNAAEDRTDEPIIASYLSNPVHITDTSAFSVIFSPSGKMVIHPVRVRNRDGYFRPDNINTSKISMDDIFNSPENIRDYPIGMFVQDDYAYIGLGAEFSRGAFVIYDRQLFDQMDNTQRYNYLTNLQPTYINPYTGTIISAN